MIEFSTNRKQASTRHEHVAQIIGVLIRKKQAVEPSLYNQKACDRCSSTALPAPSTTTVTRQHQAEDDAPPQSACLASYSHVTWNAARRSRNASRVIETVKISRRKHSQRGIALRQSRRLDFAKHPKTHSSQLLAARRLAQQLPVATRNPLPARRRLIRPAAAQAPSCGEGTRTSSWTHAVCSGTTAISADVSCLCSTCTEMPSTELGMRQPPRNHQIRNP